MPPVCLQRVAIVGVLNELGIEEGFMQEYESASHYYRPDFADAAKPFKDIRDFE